MSSIPPADVAYLSANGTKVANAHKDNPGQWQTWWWICFAGQAAFLAFVFLLTGFWSPRRAREAERRHETMVRRELAQLRAGEPGQAEPVHVPQAHQAPAGPGRIASAGTAASLTEPKS